MDQNGKRYKNPEGRFITWPLRAAVETGFHTLVEVLLKAGADQDEKDWALIYAADHHRLDLVELLVEQGADVDSITVEEIFCCRDPAIIRWFVEKGIDLETGWPIAHALRYKRREFLGIYMGLREQVPSACLQASMALRYHTFEGSLKWVSLLLWAGADPRLEVPDIESKYRNETMKTSLSVAMQRGNEEIIKKFKIDSATDDLGKLLSESAYRAEPKIVEMLIKLGADPNWGEGEHNVMHSLISSLGWSMDEKDTFYGRPPEPKLEAIEIAARAGGVWRPYDPYRLNSFRKALGRAKFAKAVGWLDRLLKCGAIEPETFTELMRTPKMQALLKTAAPGVLGLREIAGYEAAKGKVRVGSRQL